MFANTLLQDIYLEYRITLSFVLSFANFDKILIVFKWKCTQTLMSLLIGVSVYFSPLSDKGLA